MRATSLRQVAHLNLSGPAEKGQGALVSQLEPLGHFDLCFELAFDDLYARIQLELKLV